MGLLLPATFFYLAARLSLFLVLSGDEVEEEILGVALRL